ncbi:hypothetical protein [Rhodopila sp.]|uniref:hypothetical protein n=1 Tax=Rhodopila sp. TaxID=2480087 RepID=UPI003D10AC03
MIEKLRSRFPNLRERTIRNRHEFDAEFEGAIHGRRKLWAVEVSANIKGELSRHKFNSTVSRFKDAFGNSKESGLLIITPNGLSQSADWARVEMPFSVVHMTFEELDYELLFDLTDHDYPSEIAKIGHNSREFKDAIKAIDAVSHELRSSNSIGLHADVRDRLLVEIQAGKTLLGATQVRIAALRNTIWPALAFITKECAKAVVGELAKTAAKKLFALLFM